MEIDITSFYEKEDTTEFSNSIANSGLKDIGEITWQKSQNTSYEFVTDENKKEFVSYFKEFGAWDDLEEWSIEKLNTLFIQTISGDINEIKAFDSWEEYQESKQVSHNIFKSDHNKIYFYVGS